MRVRVEPAVCQPLAGAVVKRAYGAMAASSACTRCGTRHGRSAPCVPAPVTVIRGGFSETIEFGTVEFQARHRARLDRRLDRDIQKIEAQLEARKRKARKPS